MLLLPRGCLILLPVEPPPPEEEEEDIARARLLLGTCRWWVRLLMSVFEDDLDDRAKFWKNRALRLLPAPPLLLLALPLPPRRRLLFPNAALSRALRDVDVGCPRAAAGPPAEEEVRCDDNGCRYCCTVAVAIAAPAAAVCGLAAVTTPPRQEASATADRTGVARIVPASLLLMCAAWESWVCSPVSCGERQRRREKCI